MRGELPSQEFLEPPHAADVAPAQLPAPDPLPDSLPVRRLASATIPDGDECLQGLVYLGVSFRGTEEKRGVKTPIVVDGPLGGVAYRGLHGGPMLCDCRLAVALSWIGKDLLAAGVTEIFYSGAYSYRMSRVGRLSLHAYGLAIDVHELTVNGVRLTLTSDYERGAEDVCRSNQPLHRVACRLRATGLFREFLTPDSDADHYDHFHISIAPLGEDPVRRLPGSARDKHATRETPLPRTGGAHGTAQHLPATPVPAHAKDKAAPAPGPARQPVPTPSVRPSGGNPPPAARPADPGPEKPKHGTPSTPERAAAQKKDAAPAPNPVAPSGTAPGPRPAAAPKDDKPAAAPKDDKPAAAPKDDKPAAAPKDDKPAAAPKDDKPAAAPKDDKPAAAPKDDKPAAAPKDDKPAAAPKDDKPAAAPKDDKPAQGAGRGRTTAPANRGRPARNAGANRPGETSPSRGPAASGDGTAKPGANESGKPSR